MTKWPRRSKPNEIYTIGDINKIIHTGDNTTINHLTESINTLYRSRKLELQEQQGDGKLGKQTHMEYKLNTI